MHPSCPFKTGALKRRNMRTRAYSPARTCAFGTALSCTRHMMCHMCSGRIQTPIVLENMDVTGLSAELRFLRILSHVGKIGEAGRIIMMNFITDRIFRAVRLCPTRGIDAFGTVGGGLVTSGFGGALGSLIINSPMY